MHEPESVLRNEFHKIVRDFEIKAVPSIQDGRPDLGLINKKNEDFIDFTKSAGFRSLLWEASMSSHTDEFW